MKRTLILLAFSCLLVVAFAQKNYTTDEIRTGWAKKTITGVKSGNILPLLTAFNNTWRTAPATAILKDGTNPAAQDNEYHFVVDTPNGFVSAGELGDDGEDLQACVWKRSNGHKLFAVVYTRYHGLVPHPIALFYDYDATKGTLTPEFNSQLVHFMGSYPDPSVDMVHINLPQKGKDVVVSEYMMHWGFSIKQTYKWNGMEPVWSGTTIEHFDKMKKLYDATYEIPDVKFTKLALHDFDEDNNPELWVSTDNGDNQAIFAINGENDIKMVASTYFKTHLIFFENNVVGSAGSCGTGCFHVDYTKLENSRPVFRFADQQDYNYQKEDMISTYYKDDKKVSDAEGARIIKSFGEAKEITPLMHRFEAE